MKMTTAILLVLVSALLVCTEGHAQRFRYMDSSGNIHFVDSLSEVPYQYRTQIVAPTPTPVLDDRQKEELRQRQEQERRESARKKEEMQRLRQDLERDKNLQQKMRQPGATKPIVREDRIDVIR